MSHDAFVFVSYAASAIVLGALAVWIMLARRRAMRDLAALDASGIKRRSEG